MNTRTILIILLVVLVALGVFALVRSNEPEVATQPDPLTFEECAARYPVQESYPRRCVTESGVVFIENIATTTAPTPTTPNPTQPSTQQPTQPGISNLIRVTSPMNGQRITSPLTISGEARGPWYFEASFSAEVRDSSGRMIAQGPVQAQGEWMTEDFVPFRSTLSFPTQPAGSKGTVILRKANPSGDPVRDQSVTIPVTF